ncbi:MAG TPA: Rid family detoxifying hydrolase [Gemmatimonadaceae bacterium]|jgi:2-iminobutanoate/2-iminopropanoate deaminase|nr:Rid family detoxifying hydrolase [Gemmatimonadaceae bacterium]
MARTAITTDKIAKPVGPFSPAIRAGDTLYLSGQVAQDPATGKLIAGDVAAQTERIFRNIEATLQAAQLTLENVIKVNVYLTDMTNYAAMNEVFGRQFSAPYPARTTVAVVALPLGGLVELEVIAR